MGLREACQASVGYVGLLRLAWARRVEGDRRVNQQRAAGVESLPVGAGGREAAGEHRHVPLRHATPSELSRQVRLCRQCVSSVGE